MHLTQDLITIPKNKRLNQKKEIKRGTPSPKIFSISSRNWNWLLRKLGYGCISDVDEIIYKNYYDMGIAVGTEQGLVVPVLRDADQLSFADVEKGIAGLGKKAKDGKLSMADMSGATFTITNGGIYGSMLSTPIINPPQSGILGMHNIIERPVAINGKVEIRPMMYIALSYDHRIIDGKEAVTFLVKIKQLIEQPEKLLFDL